VKEALGGFHSAKIVMNSVDFGPIEKLLAEGDWDALSATLSEAALSVQAAGADFLLICTNTMHRVAPGIEKTVRIPVLHIADATAEVITAKEIKTVGLLGTAFTMEQDFYKGRLIKKHGLKVLVPEAPDRVIVNDVIFNELCAGKLIERSKKEYLRIIERLAVHGAEAVILGCTEIGQLVKEGDTEIELCDTTSIHAKKAVDYALKERGQYT